jgi:hypothetical protein
MLCTQTDPTTDCWTNTQNYYDQELAQQLNDWIAVQVNIDQWYRRNNNSNYQGLPDVSTTVARVSKYMERYFVLSADTLTPVVTALLDNANQTILSKQTTNNLIYVDMPEFKCPIPCEYDSRMWEYLFIASLLVNIAMVLVVIPFIVKTERRDKQLYAKQISMMQMLKPKSRASSIN